MSHEEQSTRLPLQCFHRILQHCDAETVCRISRCCSTFANYIDRNIEKFKRPTFDITIYDKKADILTKYCKTSVPQTIKWVNGRTKECKSQTAAETQYVEVYKEHSHTSKRTLFFFPEMNLYMESSTNFLPTIFNCRYGQRKLNAIIKITELDHIDQICDAVSTILPNSLNLNTLFWRRNSYNMDTLRCRTASVSVKNTLECWLSHWKFVKSLISESIIFVDIQCNFILRLFGSRSQPVYIELPLNSCMDCYKTIKRIITEWPQLEHVSYDAHAIALIETSHYNWNSLASLTALENSEKEASSFTIKHHWWPVVLRIRFQQHSFTLDSGLC